jgi:hypothetical protein
MVKEKMIPFPQANNMLLMIELLRAIDSNDDQKKFPKIVNRQIHYYKGALQYFDMLDNKGRVTLKGKYIKEALDITEQNKMLRNIIISKPVFREVDEYMKLTLQFPPVEIISNFIGNYYNYNETTRLRRANAVVSIFKYLNN